ncbi:MAG: IgGFc-binding protein [Pseudomonadota bacterium]
MIRGKTLLVSAVFLAGCGSPTIKPGGECTPQQVRCDSNRYQICSDDGTRWMTQADCTDEEKVCIANMGCLTCYPNQITCEGFDIVRCRPNGSVADKVGACDPEQGELCAEGKCVNACQWAAEALTYEGCEYWAVDLDNAVVSNQGTAAAQQYSIVVTNPLELPATVTVEVNEALPGEAPKVKKVAEAHLSRVVGGGDMAIINLQPREVDCSSDPRLNDGTGTCLSSNAYHLRSTAPVVAYQFNPLENVNVFSNDASLLLPNNALGDSYLAMGWPQTIALTNNTETNMLSHLRAFLTIVGTESDTKVQITLTTRILGTEKIPVKNEGDTFEVALGPYDVLNLETDDFNADFTGTSIVGSDEDKPFVVFTGSEASDSPRFESFLDRRCCADHMEQQLFPESALGTRFIAVKTPLRSVYVEEAGWDVAVAFNEPEYWRVLATREDTSITTNLPPPGNVFFLQRGDSVIFKTVRDFVVQASRPISLGQFPGGQQTTGIPSTLPGGQRPPGGDPSFILIPPIEQWRDHYLFLVPNKYAFDFLLIAAPTDAEITYDNLPLEAVLECEYELVGELAEGEVEVEYQAIRCPLSAPSPAGPGLQDDGVHTLDSNRPIGLVVWGFDSYVSYGYPGGTNVDLINLE